MTPTPSNAFEFLREVRRLHTGRQQSEVTNRHYAHSFRIIVAPAEYDNTTFDNTSPTYRKLAELLNHLLNQDASEVGWSRAKGRCLIPKSLADMFSKLPDDHQGRAAFLRQPISVVPDAALCAMLRDRPKLNLDGDRHTETGAPITIVLRFGLREQTSLEGKSTPTFSPMLRFSRHSTDVLSQSVINTAKSWVPIYADDPDWKRACSIDALVRNCFTIISDVVADNLSSDSARLQIEIEALKESADLTLDYSGFQRISWMCRNDEYRRFLKGSITGLGAFIDEACKRLNTHRTLLVHNMSPLAADLSAVLVARDFLEQQRNGNGGGYRFLQFGNLSKLKKYQCQYLSDTVILSRQLNGNIRDANARNEMLTAMREGMIPIIEAAPEQKLHLVATSKASSWQGINQECYRALCECLKGSSETVEESTFRLPDEIADPLTKYIHRLG